MTDSESSGRAIVQEDGDNTGVRVRPDSMLPNQYFVIEEYDEDGATERVTIAYDEVDALNDAIKEVR